MFCWRNETVPRYHIHCVVEFVFFFSPSRYNISVVTIITLCDSGEGEGYTTRDVLSKNNKRELEEHVWWRVTLLRPSGAHAHNRNYAVYLLFRWQSFWYPSFTISLIDVAHGNIGWHGAGNVRPRQLSATIQFYSVMIIMVLCAFNLIGYHLRCVITSTRPSTTAIRITLHTLCHLSYSNSTLMPSIE